MCKQHILNTDLYNYRLIHELCSFKIHHRSENKNLYAYFILPALLKKDCAHDGIFNLYLACM